MRCSTPLLLLLPVLAGAQNTYDSRIDAYRGLDFPCDGQLTPVLRIQNVGTSTMNTCVVETWKNGVIDNSFNWILAVPAPTGAYRQPALPPVTVNDGDTLEYRIISVNGQPDQGATENILNKEVEEEPLPAGGYTVQVEILTDDFPGETTWLIRSESGTVVAQGGPYTVSNNVEVSYVGLSASECYQFEVYDSAGDGINALSRSAGYAKVKNLGATLIDIPGGSFTAVADDGLKTGGDPCAPTKLTTAPTPLVSCGATNLLVNGTHYLYADVVPGANKYQFKFTNVPGQPAYSRNIAVTGNALQLSPWATKPLKAGRTYNVQVRTSFDGGATWCAFGTSCTISIAGSWSTQDPGTRIAHAEDAMAAPPVLLLYPNPSPDGAFSFGTGGLAEGSGTATLNVFDPMGRTVCTRNVAVDDGASVRSFIPDRALSPGLYIVQLNAGEVTVTERLVVR